MGTIKYSDYLNLLSEDFKVRKLNGLDSALGKMVVDLYFKNLDTRFFSRVCVKSSCSIKTMRELQEYFSSVLLSEKVMADIKYYLKRPPTEGIPDMDVFNALSCLENLKEEKGRLVVTIRDKDGGVKRLECVGLVNELDQFFYYKHLNEELSRLSPLYSKTTTIPKPRQEHRQRMGNYFSILVLLYSIDKGITKYSELQSFYNDIYLLSVACEKGEISLSDIEGFSQILAEYQNGERKDEVSLKSFNREVLNRYRGNDFSIFLFSNSIVSDIEKHNWYVPACREKILAAVYHNRHTNKEKRENIRY